MNYNKYGRFLWDCGMIIILYLILIIGMGARISDDTYQTLVGIFIVFSLIFSYSVFGIILHMIINSSNQSDVEVIKDERWVA